MWRSIQLSLCIIFALATTAHAERIPAEVWADSMEVRGLQMSPDGSRFLMLQRTERGGNPRIVVFGSENLAESMRVINLDEDSTVISASWKGNSRVIFQAIVWRERAGDPIAIRRIMSVDPDNADDVIDLLDGGGSARNRRDDALSTLRAFVPSYLPYDRENIIVAFPGAGFSAEYYRVNVYTGARDRVARSDDSVSGFGFDVDGEVRFASSYVPSERTQLSLARIKGETAWQTVGMQRSDSRLRFAFMGLPDPDQPNLALISTDRAGTDNGAVYQFDLRTPDERELVFYEPGYEPGSIIRSPLLADRGRMIGLTYANGTREYNDVTDPEWGPLYASIEATFPDANFAIESVSDDRRSTLIQVSGPQEPGAWYLLRDGQLARLMGASTEIRPEDLAPMREVIVTARDGRPIPVLATIPEGDGPFPGIVMPHGGPWVREFYGYDRSNWAPMLANQGYVVIQPNYRGSSGLGLDHWLAGDNQWGLAMQDDMEDAILHFVNEGIVDRSRMGFFGWSYGGYAAMTAATRNNGLFNCAAAGAGVSDIGRIRGGLTGSRFLRDYQYPTISGFNPLEHADEVRIPMLIVHGDADSTVPVDHSRRWVNRLDSTNAWHNYIEIDDMFHSPFDYEDNMQWIPQLLEFFETRCEF